MTYDPHWMDKLDQNYWKKYQENGYNPPDFSVGVKHDQQKLRYDLVDDSLYEFVYDGQPDMSDYYDIEMAIIAVRDKDMRHAVRILYKIFRGETKESVRTRLAEVLTHGANKYADHNWKKVAKGRYYAAAERHLTACNRDLNAIDEDSGISHCVLAFANIYFCLWFIREGM